MLAEAGVIETGASLNSAAQFSREASVKFLLLQQDLNTGGAAAYVNNLLRSRPNSLGFRYHG